MKKNELTDTYGNFKHQRFKLQLLLTQTLSNIPLYKDVDLNVRSDDFDYSEFQKLPIISKEIIRKNSADLLNANYSKPKEVFPHTSGGSTGSPVRFFRTKDQTNQGLANFYYAVHSNEVNIFDRSVDLWGAERDMHNPKKFFDYKKLIYNKTTLNTFVLSDEIIKRYIHKLNDVKPKFIKAYVHSIYDIAKFINSNNLKILFTPVIHCTTGPLYPEMEIEIRKAFNNCHVYSFYGSREVSAIATETPTKDGMYVLYDNVFVEILNDEGEPVKYGEEGEVVVTTLNNFYMPLIRYRIGDRAIKGDHHNFGTLILKKVVGRTLGSIKRKDGSSIDGQFFTTLFFNKKGIKNFQLIQKDILFLKLNIVKSEIFDSKELDEIIQRVKTELPDVVLDTVFCEKIDLTSTGKIMYVYSEL
ncbi:phenylacetate--CoA ligase family protein [Sphingobacterium griseoflavum]|uniref:Capsular polysaccharide biosynthesis protein n=1 Tax=Sphingobacterium griseoflavum TaxID=1474952 RepID=A0ABQ3HWK2_9SPHI|nr:phenylacetate--CoA ligase family protein [Sphingobacterium griseoflavum]GHE38926.1 capsular polysaccharide biosynthesis protein [Sphingobacterium griseoflavum]